MHRHSYQELEPQLESQNMTSEKAIMLAQELKEFLKSRGELMPSRPIISRAKIGLGTSDVIESIFGKFKVFIKGCSEIGKLALIIPAFLGQITPPKIKDALESVHQQDVEDWIQEYIGQSTLSKRRQAFPKMEQNYSFSDK